MLKKRKFIIIVVSIICLINLGKAFGKGLIVSAEKKEEIKVVEETNEYLQSLESKDVSDIENEIKEKNEKEIEANNLVEQEDDDKNIDFKVYFKDTVFVGDSITEFISEFNLLNPKNVYAKKGDSLLKAKNNIEKIKYANPERIVILLGMNDVSAFKDEKDFKKEYIQYVNNIKSSLPNTKIYLESPTLVQAKGENFETGLTNERIKLFQNEVKEAAKETNTTYVELNELINSGDYYEQDGIHFKSNFYQELFKLLKKTIDNER